MSTFVLCHTLARLCWQTVVCVWCFFLVAAARVRAGVSSCGCRGRHSLLPLLLVFSTEAQSTHTSDTTGSYKTVSDFLVASSFKQIVLIMIKKTTPTQAHQILPLTLTQSGAAGFSVCVSDHQSPLLGSAGSIVCRVCHRFLAARTDNTAGGLSSFPDWICASVYVQSGTLLVLRSELNGRWLCWTKSYPGTIQHCHNLMMSTRK